MQTKIGIIVGSLRTGSNSKQLAEAIKAVAQPSLSVVDIAISDLALYNQDLDTDTPPAPWAAFRAAVKAVDAVVFVTPEHNRSIPAAVKNAVDIGSRPYGKSVWIGKPTAIVTQGNGVLGGTAANQQLRLVMSVLSSPVLPGNEMYIGKINTLFDDQGKFNNPDTEKLAKSFLQALETWTQRFK